MPITQAILVALPLATTIYGAGEMYCGDIGKPQACALGATTASGEAFDPDRVSAAVPAATNVRMRPRYMWLRLRGLPDAPCVRVRINDKKNPRYVGNGGLDLTPEAVRQLTGAPPRSTWGHPAGAEQCEPKGEAE